MAKPTPAIEVKPDIYIVGLTRTGPNRFAIVTGTVASPKIDVVSQPLEYAAESLKMAMLNLMQTVP